MRHAVPKSTETRADKRARRVFIDLAGPFHVESLPGSRSCSTIGEGGDTTIPSPGRSPKHTLPGIGLHDPLHGQQACPESNSFHQGVGQICPR